jgi:hypothetical protein
MNKYNRKFMDNQYIIQYGELYTFNEKIRLMKEEFKLWNDEYNKKLNNKKNKIFNKTSNVKGICKTNEKLNNGNCDIEIKNPEDIRYNKYEKNFEK